MNETDKAYIAGIVDGEGCFSSKGYKGSIGLSIVNTNKKLMDWLVSKIGCNLKVREGRGFGKRLQYTIDLNTEDTVNLLYDIEPFLIVKKEHAKILLYLARLTNEALKGTGYMCFKGFYNPTPENIVLERENVKRKLRQLNGRVL